jgi:hypothetical protein
MAKDFEREIARTIIYAQVASDGGKHISDIARINRHTYPIWKSGYDSKDGLLMKAIVLIGKSKESNFRYFVSKGDIHNSSIVYFNFRIGGRRYQVSFHTFSNKVRRYTVKRGRYATRWDEKSSRDACKVLADAYEI